jgi:hypothetical protein
MAGSQKTIGKVTLAIRWLARIWSIASIGFVLLIVVGELIYPHSPPPTTIRDWVGLILFPFGTCLGLVLAWRWEGVGGAIAAGSLLGFYLVMWMIDGQLPRGPYFALVGTPGILFLAAWAGDHWFAQVH